MKLPHFGSAAMVLTVQSCVFAQDMPVQPTPFAALIDEGESSNTQITAAGHGVLAAGRSAPQKTALIDGLASGINRRPVHPSFPSAVRRFIKGSEGEACHD
jgi:hypothetical protein